MADLSVIDGEILEAASIDSTVKSCVEYLKNDDLQYQGMLEMMVLELLSDKRLLQRELSNKVKHVA